MNLEQEIQDIGRRIGAEANRYDDLIGIVIVSMVIAAIIFSIIAIVAIRKRKNK